MSSKIDVIKTLLEKADKVIIVGGMVFTFDKARGFGVSISPRTSCLQLRVCNEGHSRVLSQEPALPMEQRYLASEVLLASWLQCPPRPCAGAAMLHAVMRQAARAAIWALLSPCHAIPNLRS